MLAITPGTSEKMEADSAGADRLGLGYTSALGQPSVRSPGPVLGGLPQFRGGVPWDSSNDSYLQFQTVKTRLQENFFFFKPTAS